MAHPCWSCMGDCYCHGDIDDIICSHTPANCDGCGSGLCDRIEGDEDDWDADEEWDDYDDEM